MKKLYILLSVAFVSVSASAQVVISQVYGAGGNNGAVLNRDYVELFNRGTTAVNMTGWSIQYNSAAGTNAWNANALPAGATIQPGKYYLIAFGPDGANGAALPTPDYSSTAVGFLALSGTAGKLILANVATAYPAGGCVAPVNEVIDAVSFGPNATCFEGSGPTPVLSATLAAFRANNGCTDTNDNAADFTTATPAPRNSATAANTCNLSVKENDIAGLKVYPNPVTNGKLFITTDSNVEKTVAIYDVLGKQVVNTKATDFVSVSNLKGGVYIVKITEEGKTATRKLVIK